MYYISFEDPDLFGPNLNPDLTFHNVQLNLLGHVEENRLNLTTNNNFSVLLYIMYVKIDKKNFFIIQVIAWSDSVLLNPDSSKKARIRILNAGYYNLYYVHISYFMIIYYTKVKTACPLCPACLLSS